MMAARSTIEKWWLVLASLFLGVEFIIGVLFVVFALLLRTPPRAAIPIALLIIGGLTLFNTVFGCVSICCKRTWLTTYIILHCLLIIAQIIISAYIGGRYNKVAFDIVTSGNNGGTEYHFGDVEFYLTDSNLGFYDVRRKLIAFRLVLIILVVIEWVIVIAFIIIWCCKTHGPKGNSGDVEGRHHTQMSQMPPPQQQAPNGISGRQEKHKGGAWGRGTESPRGSAPPKGMSPDIAKKYGMG